MIANNNNTDESQTNQTHQIPTAAEQGFTPEEEEELLEKCERLIEEFEEQEESEDDSMDIIQKP